MSNKISNLYVFAIGGTGSRVLRSLSFLLASGCNKKKLKKVIPVIIDPDLNNGDLNRTKTILNHYRSIHQDLDRDSGFFWVEIDSVSKIQDNNENQNDFKFSLKNLKDNKFRKFIGFDDLEDDGLDQNFIRLFYSEKNLEADLEVGFKGNPNMGAVVLNQFNEKNTSFKTFYEKFNPDTDAIFIINSIFGGTGAAGLPLLLENLRDKSKEHTKNAIIGGITYLPYFTVQKKEENDEINSGTFFEKTKVALGYYNEKILTSTKDKIDRHYFIGNNEESEAHDYSTGAEDQKNKANFLEFAGALAILDFFNDIPNLRDGNKHIESVVKEFGILDPDADRNKNRSSNDADENDKNRSYISFDNLGEEDKKTIEKPLKKFIIFSRFLRDNKKTLQRGDDKYEYYTRENNQEVYRTRWLQSNIKSPFNNIKSYEKSFFSREYFKSDSKYRNIEEFNEYFEKWLEEMKKSSPSFDINYNHKKPLKLIDVGGKEFTKLDIQVSKNIEKVQKKYSNDSDSLKNKVLIILIEKSIEDLINNKKSK